MHHRNVNGLESVATVDCGGQRCLQGDTDLSGEPILGDNGILYVAVTDDNLAELQVGDDAGPSVDSQVTELSDGFVDLNGFPIDISDDGGLLDVVDVSDVDEELLNDLLGSAGRPAAIGLRTPDAAAAGSGGTVPSRSVESSNGQYLLMLRCTDQRLLTTRSTVAQMAEIEQFAEAVIGAS